MFETLSSYDSRLEELNLLLTDPAVLADQDRYRKLAREHARLLPIVNDYRSWQELRQSFIQHQTMLDEADDAAFKDLIKEEMAALTRQISDLEQNLQDAMVLSDPNDDRNIVMEIRSGAGGDEAALFAADLYRMYVQYAEQRGWRVQIVDVHETEIGGFKEVVFRIEGEGAYSRLRYESGVHRVQRVPTTESGGRIHTSTVTVAVLPEAEDVEVTIRPEDLEIDTYRASGAGGQHVNRTDSAIRITHKPTGIVVTCQDQRSQYKNKDQAMAVLKARLYDLQSAEQAGSRAEDRRSQVGTGDRSERIRTYNFHQGRVTDHRIGLTVYRLETVLSGDIDEFINALMTAAHAKQMHAAEQSDDEEPV